MSDPERPTEAPTRPTPSSCRSSSCWASLALFTGAFAVSVNRQALNTDNWQTTSSELLADEQLRAALSAYLVDQLFTSVDVTGAIEQRLPSNLQVLAAGRCWSPTRSRSPCRRPWRVSPTASTRACWPSCRGAIWCPRFGCPTRRSGASASWRGSGRRPVDTACSGLGHHASTSAVRSEVHAWQRCEPPRQWRETRDVIGHPCKGKRSRSRLRWHYGLASRRTTGWTPRRWWTRSRQAFGLDP